MNARTRRRRIGPFSFAVDLPDAASRRTFDALYALYPEPEPPGFAEFALSVRLTSPWRRLARPQVGIHGAVPIPFVPLPLRLAPVAAEMGMNFHVAFAMNRLLLLHGAAVARGDGALIFSADSGSGKSTLAAGLGYGGWRFLADEFVLVEPGAAIIRPFPRPVSLKNQSIAIMTEIAGADRLSERFPGTPKGTIAYLRPPDAAIAAMDEPAEPRAILFPRFAAGIEPHAERITASECFVRLSAASTNASTLGEAGFLSLWALANLPAYNIFYGDMAAGAALADTIWSESANG